MTTTTTLGELTGDYILDPAGTRIGFAARQAIFTTVRGQFTEFAGSAHLDGDDPSKSSARLTIQAASIQTSSSRRDDHLRRAFLDTSDHPAITFTSTGVEQLSETTFRLTGDLTIRGATKPVTVDFELTGAGYDQQGAFRAGFPGRGDHQPPGLGRQLERRAGGRRRPGQQQGDAGVRLRRRPAVLTN